MPPSPQNKAVFANQLRAVACLCVITVHLIGVFWAARDVVSGHIFAPEILGPQSRIFPFISYSHFNLGPFGVALFFLISGFVVPMSINNAARGRFLAARALRIYPTYILCLLIGLVAVYCSSRYWNLPFTWTANNVWENALLLKGIGLNSIDMVNWSLAIELKFYLLVCVLAVWIRKGRILPLLVLTVCVLLAVDYLPYDFIFMPYLFIGTLFSYHYQLKISGHQLAWSAVLMMGLWTAVWPRSVLAEQFPIVTLNYFYALAIFGIAYAYRGLFVPLRGLDFVAAISYPLYAVHPLLGYASIRFLMDHNIAYVWALALSVALIFGVAYLVHRAVELPTMRLGKQVLRRIAVVA
ncbi:acyltransferase [Undibacterium sp.]|jgi:peptidoglycan/LPS O-acetylase OafA/YrhL|uniref:acyltransferase family protein n=1 Tax=Undibacterium sp. TaxID=1914977 RepID=UPI002C8B5B93|nr:acyltransferase [Undibacterium sp.]HTD04663.1 acyltransferase [Undibacterium sp.]